MIEVTCHLRPQALMEQVNSRSAAFRKSDLAWHYTTPSKLKEILISEGILPLSYASSEHRVAWFSTNREWENSVQKSPINYSVKYSKALGMVRIGVRRTRTERWPELQKRAKMRRSISRYIREQSVAKNAFVHHWRGTLDAVSAADWVSIEVFVTGKWKPLSSMNILEQLIDQELAESRRQEAIASDFVASMLAVREDDPPKPKRKRQPSAKKMVAEYSVSQTESTALPLMFE